MEWQKKYRWVRTWPDDLGRDGKPVEDYAAYDGEHYAGRIRLDCESLKKGHWQWSGSWRKAGASGPIMPHHGFKPTATEAARAVEDYWDSMLDRARGEN